MKQRPILFSAPMVRALLAGQKTQTRRVVKWRGVDTGLNLQFSGLRAIQDRAGLWALESDTRTSREARCDLTPCPYGQPGDRLWVREAWKASSAHDDLPPIKIPRCDPLAYAADGEHPILLGKGRPSIHMPRWASRITLEITGVRVERLQMISKADAIAEGIEQMPCTVPNTKLWRNYDPTNDWTPRVCFPQNSFRSLWSSINGAESWDANPWVWVVEFKKVEA